MKAGNGWMTSASVGSGVPSLIASTSSPRISPAERQPWASNDRIGASSSSDDHSDDEQAYSGLPARPYRSSRAVLAIRVLDHDLPSLKVNRAQPVTSTPGRPSTGRARSLPIQARMRARTWTRSSDDLLAWRAPIWAGSRPKVGGHGLDMPARIRRDRHRDDPRIDGMRSGVRSQPGRCDKR